MKITFKLLLKYVENAYDIPTFSGQFFQVVIADWTKVIWDEEMFAAW